MRRSIESSSVKGVHLTIVMAHLPSPAMLALGSGSGIGGITDG
jgi:hypothetical protein